MMTTNRLEAFSDGVLAIIITIMVLEFEIPHGSDVEVLKPLLPTFITYILSFIYLAIYWINHHTLIHKSTQVDNKVLWANLHLLFWLSLFPFATGYLGRNVFESLPTAVYGLIMLMASIAWSILVSCIRKIHYKESEINYLYSNKLKPYSSMIIYGSAIVISFVSPLISCVLFILIAFLWIVK